MEDIREMVGKRLLAGITYLGDDSESDRKIEFVGQVVSVDPLVLIEVDGWTEPFTLPPMPDAFDAAAPGEYRLRSTGELVVDPDFLTSWTVESDDAR